MRSGGARSRLVELVDYEVAALMADHHPALSGGTIVDAWGSFSQSKSRLGLVDFADLLEIAADLLRRWS